MQKEVQKNKSIAGVGIEFPSKVFSSWLAEVESYLTATEMEYVKENKLVIRIALEARSKSLAYEAFRIPTVDPETNFQTIAEEALADFGEKCLRLVSAVNPSVTERIKLNDRTYTAATDCGVTEFSNGFRKLTRQHHVKYFMDDFRDFVSLLQDEETVSSATDRSAHTARITALKVCNMFKNIAYVPQEIIDKLLALVEEAKAAGATLEDCVEDLPEEAASDVEKTQS